MISAIKRAWNRRKGSLGISDITGIFTAEAPTKTIHLETEKAEVTGKTDTLERGSLRDLGYDVGDGLTKMIMASDMDEEDPKKKA